MSMPTLLLSRLAGVVTLVLPMAVASTMASAPIAHGAAAATAANGKIAFATQRAEFIDMNTPPTMTGDIWTVDPDGDNLVNLTGGGSHADDTYDYFPAWSPDGTRIAFASNRAGTQSIWVMDEGGENPVQVTTAPAGAQDGWVSWSHDGTRLLFARDPDGSFTTQSLHGVNVDGSGMTQLTSGSNDWHPRMSPDGSHLAFVSERGGSADFPEIWVKNLADDQLSNLTGTIDAAEFGAEWSPDGTELAYTRCDAGYTECSISVMGADGSNPTAVTETSGVENEPAWSPDGERIAFRTFAVDELGNPSGTLTGAPSSCQQFQKDC